MWGDNIFNVDVGRMPPSIFNPKIKKRKVRKKKERKKERKEKKTNNQVRAESRPR
jgi:hypothetical protein